MSVCMTGRAGEGKVKVYACVCVPVVVSMHFCEHACMNAHVCAHMHLSVNLVHLLHDGGHTGVQSHPATMFSLSRILERYIVMRSTPQ